MNAVKSNNNNKNEQQLIADLAQAASAKLEASLHEFTSGLLTAQQQQLQQFASTVLADSQKQWQQRLIEQEQAYQKLFKDWQQTKQQLDLAVPVATADNQELSALRQQQKQLSAEVEKTTSALLDVQQERNDLQKQLAQLQPQREQLTG